VRTSATLGPTILRHEGDDVPGQNGQPRSKGGIVRQTLVAWALLVGVAACSNSMGSSPGAARVSIAQEIRSLVVGYAATAKVEVVDASGALILPVPSLTWTSRDPGIISVDANGRVLPIRYGTAWLVVALRDRPAVTDSLLISVYQPL
jgi:hypothetical protein